MLATAEQVGLQDGSFDARVVVPVLCDPADLAAVAAAAINVTAKEMRAGADAASKVLGCGDQGNGSGAGLRHVQKAAALAGSTDKEHFAQVLALLAANAAEAEVELLPQRWGATRGSDKWAGEL